MAWKALTSTYDDHTKEARTACHVKLVNAKMEPGQDPGDLVVIVEKFRDLQAEMGQGHHPASSLYGI